MSYPGWTALPLLVLFSTCYCIPDGDLCRWMNGRKYYIDVGESGLINAENVSSQVSLTHPMGLKVPLSGNGSTHLQIPQRCSVELITCPSCHFRVTVMRMDIPTCSVDKSCRCDFVWIKEAAYSKSGQEFCGQISANSTPSLFFESKTKLVSVDFLYTGSYTDAFSLQFSAIKNVYVYKGGFDYYQSNSTGTITSPNFPGGYPSDYSAEYILQNVDTTGYVQLLFTDFQLSLWSYMEILDSNGSRIDVYNGNTFRPPALISSGPIMTVKFQANEEYPSSGFRAIYTFVNSAEKYWINRPSTDCGGFVEDYGGAITMMNMVPGNVMRAFDCIWLIRPQNAGVPGTQISVRVAQFEEMGPKSTLTIRKGLYSESTIVESITPFQQHKLRRGQEYVEQASIGFYIRLIGHFNNRSHLAIIYSTFRYEGCYAVGDLECENGRCIKNALRCDGFNHCSDGSDEASCYGANQGTPLPEDANWWRTLTPNYYFPKSDSSPSAGTNTLILVTSLAGLGMFVLTTIVILVKLHKQRQDDSISQEILQTISADIEAENSQYNQIPPSDPPIYDPPPTYEDVIKYYLPPPPAYSSINQAQNNSSRVAQITRDRADNQGPNTRGRGRRSRASKHRNSVLAEATEPSILRVTLPSEENNRDSRTSEATSKDFRVSSATGALPLNTTTVHSSKTTNNATSNLSCTQSSPMNIDHVKNAAICKTPLIKTVKKCHFLRTTNDSLSCDCDGACSCLSAKQKSSGAIRIDGNDARTKRPSLLGSSLCTEDSSKFKDALKTLNDNKALKSKIVSPPQKVIVIPSRSKSFANEDQSSKKMNSKSAGSSSPTEHHINPCQSMHRRSSSGPSEILTHHQNQGSTNSNVTDATDSSLSQMTNPATAIVSGSSGLQSAEDHIGPKTDTNILPSGWGALWNPAKRRSDVPLTLNTDGCSWQPNDKQPLLRQTSKTHDLKATPYQGSVGSPIK